MSTVVTYKGQAIDLSAPLADVSARSEIAHRFMALESALGVTRLLDWMSGQPLTDRQALLRCVWEVAGAPRPLPGAVELCGGRMTPGSGDLARACALLRRGTRQFIPPPPPVDLGQAVARVGTILDKRRSRHGK